MNNCESCLTTSKNTGNSKTAKPFGAVVKIFGYPITATDGTSNKLDLSVPLTQTILDGLINNTDPSKRLYPIEIEDFASAMSESTFKTWKGGSKEKVGDGTRSFEAQVRRTTSQYFKQLESLGGCDNMGYLFMDGCENLRGDGSEAGYVKPVKQSANTYDAIMNWAVDSESTEWVTIKFEAHKYYKDSDLVHIYGSSIDADLEGSEGLIDVTLESITATATGDTIQFTPQTNFGDASGLETVVGLVPADVTPVIGGASTTFSSLTVQADGSYIGVTTAVITVADVVTITGSKNGLNFTNVGTDIAA